MAVTQASSRADTYKGTEVNNLVTVTQLNKHFGAIHAVNNLTFQVAKGEVLGFLGPNGAGKSTTMKMITGFLTPDSGEVVVVGQSLSGNPVGVKKAIGYLPEGAPLYGDMTTRAFLMFIASMRGLSGKSMLLRMEEVVEDVNLGSVLDQNLDTLSKGFKRRVGIAQAILHDPPVLILDEPTDGLDPNQKHEVRQLIASMASRKAIILSTHILEEVETVCTRAMVISAGTIVADDTPRQLAARNGDQTWIVEPVDPSQLPLLRESLGRIRCLSHIEPVNDGDGTHSLKITVRNEPGLVTLRRHLKEHPVGIAQFYREHRRLDDVFREITDGASRLS
jgi:ABC-2 type transport system ATP-binding protein